MYSLVLPCFNEAESLPSLLEECAALLAAGCDEIVIVNNGSEDGSEAILEKYSGSIAGLKVVTAEQNLGYGGGILLGLSHTEGDIVGWTHADLQCELNDFLLGADLVRRAGARAIAKGRRRGRPNLDRFFTWGMSCFESVLFRTLLWDINAQPTVFHRQFVKHLEGAPTDFTLDLYVLAHARKQKFIVKRFPVSFKTRRHGQSSWNHGMRSRLRFVRRTIKSSFALVLRGN